METIKLYDNDSYSTVFSAEVLSCEKRDSSYEVILDRTLFFPEEGGQSPDKGVLGGANVLDVQINKGVITHTLDTPLNAGETVAGKIDWDHRFSNMQQHSAEHIFSGLVKKMYGYNNVGFHLSDNIVTLDFDGVLSDTQVSEIEYLVNEAIAKNVPVTVTFPTKEELSSLDYRSKIEIEGQVRIVTVEGYDVCACCAPHVKRTGEIGGMKVQSVQNYKGGVRISILCGFRALKAACEKADVISGLTGLLTTNQERLTDVVKKQMATIQTLKQELVAAKKELLSIEISKIDPSSENVILFCSDIDGKTIRNAVNDLVKLHPGYTIIFSGTDSNGYSYILGSQNRDCKELAERLKENFGAKGGGSALMIQGQIPAKEAEIRAFLAF